MSCTNPIYAHDMGIKSNGKRDIKVLGQRKHIESATLAQLENMLGVGKIIPLPCGKCLACRKAKAREWASRCVLEATEYNDNCFITLTFEDTFYNPSKSGLKADLRNFFKRLRKDYQFRYYAVCERGTEKGRYHFHALLFGIDLTTKQLEKYWPFGFVDSGSLTAASCFYVCQYAEKKIFGNNDPLTFNTMSTHPGLGYDWFFKHYDVSKYGQVFGSFGSNVMPRYFEKVAANVYGEVFSDLKDEKLSKSNAKRVHEMLIHGFDTVEELWSYQEAIDINNFLHKEIRKDL